MLFNELVTSVMNCRECEKHLPLGPRPVIRINPASKILIIGQAPGKAVHLSGVPWDDKSGDNLRSWLGVDKSLFYDEKSFALMPMGFCYPGTGRSGDLPPRPECAPYWHEKLIKHMKKIRLTILIGKYAQEYYLGGKQKINLTETVKVAAEFLPSFFPLPHPSPRNNIWQKKNPWFATEVVPVLRAKISSIVEKY